LSQTLDRALTILELVAEKPRRITDIATELDVHHSTALRLLHTLRNHGFVHLEEDKRYRLGSAVFRLANQALEVIDLRDIAKPHMVELSRRTGETVHLAILQEHQVVYVEKVEALHPVRMYSRIGATAPLHCSGVAKAVLMAADDSQRKMLLDGYEFLQHTPRTLTSEEALFAELTESADRGYTRDNEEHEPGIHCVAAPVRSADGSVVGAISITAPSSRVSGDELLGFVPDLREITAAVSKDLGWRP
jgi:IclR family transcriptional regulator, KDG regulon repressor